MQEGFLSGLSDCLGPAVVLLLYWLWSNLTIGISHGKGDRLDGQGHLHDRS